MGRRRGKKRAGTQTLGRFSIPEVLDHFGDYDRVYGDWVVNMASDRYLTFMVRGYRCASCGLEATFFLLQKNRHQETNPQNRAHFNLYAEVGDRLVLFTKDHIHPKAKGGKSTLENYQTMCAPCNVRKMDTVKETGSEHTPPA